MKPSGQDTYVLRIFLNDSCHVSFIYLNDEHVFFIVDDDLINELSPSF